MYRSIRLETPPVVSLIEDCSTGSLFYKLNLMSTRAIRALQGSNEVWLAKLASTTESSVGVVDDNDDDDDEEDDDDESLPKARTSAFVAMIDDDDEEDDEDDEDNDSDENGRSQTGANDGGTSNRSCSVSRDTIQQSAPKTIITVIKTHEGVATEEEEENIDALLDEFRDQDIRGEDVKDQPTITSNNVDYFNVILKGLDCRDLDVDYCMRNALLGTSDTTAPLPARRMGTRQSPLFGPARDGWTRPPHYVGGGIGMTTYDQQARNIPWPYNQVETTSSYADRTRWFCFMHSDSYERDCRDFEIIQQSGDLNALVMFIVHHPFVTEALLQLTSVLYQTNHSQEGLALLRRCLWIYDCSALLSFTRKLDADKFLDIDQPENRTFFCALFKLLQVSHMAGIPRTAAAVGRYILSLDPLRDPMRVLPILDVLVLSNRSDERNQWLVELVESHRITIHHRYGVNSESAAGLLDFPNWNYSYALAIFRLARNDPGLLTKANEALQCAIKTFPSVVGQVLQELDVDVTGRSFRCDWVRVLEYTTARTKEQTRAYHNDDGAVKATLLTTLKSIEVLIKIYTKQSTKIWVDDDVIQWLYDNLKHLLENHDAKEISALPNPALGHYATCKAEEYDNRIELFPQDANILDPGLIAHAMAIDPNRPRLLRNMPRGIGQRGYELNGQRQGPVFAGPPLNIVDPDWPILEVFWRSFLPWNHVEGVPPPAR